MQPTKEYLNSIIKHVHQIPEKHETLKAYVGVDI